MRTLIQRFIDLFFSIPAPLAIGAVFLLTASEAALFFGFVIPGEISVVLGGVLAARGNVPLFGVLSAAALGAILGDFIGFQIGRRFGTSLLERRFPKRWPPVREWFLRRGPPAVFLGRSTAFLRAVVPTAAGAARMRPAQFLLWNVLGGATWATTFTLVGYFAGEGYQIALRWAGRGSAALATLVAALVSVIVLKHYLVRRWTR